MNSTDEECGYTPRNYAKVLRCLLSPDGYERLAADSLLFTLLVHEEKDANGCWSGRIAEAFSLIGADADRFLAAVIASTAIEAEEDWRRLMADSSRVTLLPSVDWRVPELDDYPLDRPIIVESNAWIMRLGAPYWLSRIGPVAVDRVAQLTRLLAHPSLDKQAFEALASIGVGAREAIGPMLELLMKVGPHSAIERGPEGLLRVAANETDFDTRLLDALGESPPSDTAVSAVCAVLWRMPGVEVKTLDRLYDLARRSFGSTSLSALAWAGTRISRRLGVDAARWLELAREFADAEDAVLRSAAAQMLGEEPSTGFGSDIVVRLASDDDPVVRLHAYQAASTWCDPPPAAIDAAVGDLSNFDACDGDPGSSAARALGAWKEASARALADIVVWAESVPARLECNDEDNMVVFKIIAIAEGLGVHAKAMLPAIEAVAAWFEARDANEDADGGVDEDADVTFDDDDAVVAVPVDRTFFDPAVDAQFAEMAARMEAEQAESLRIKEQSDPTDLARRLGIPVDEDIPGTTGSGGEYGNGETMRRLAERIAAL